ncbi:MAG: alpha/beta fold hydrolase [Gammaproteobacteria bacterium]|nr:alpha/beta fold hydrolase [Gammaproteobacteria bacterium]
MTTPAQSPPASPEIGHSVAVDGLATNYHDVGAGPPVLLLHGSGPGVSAWANWRLNLPVLAQRYRVVAPDLLGFGYTAPAPGQQYSLARWLQHLVGFLDALAIERVSVVGNSFGGALALALAVQYPARVARLVLMGAAGVDFELTPGLDAVWGYTPSAANMRQLIETFAYNQALVSDDLAQLRFRASVRPGVYENYASMFPPPRQAHIGELAQPVALLAGLVQPTLILHGREDRIIPLACSLQLLQLIPHAQLHVFGHCGHWTQIEYCADFNRLVGDFLAP